ncbi:branched-chain amino acid transport system permease protein [Rhodoligotrophos appendicifer]|uniref:branched-chain amino acid ABC transporter permease n=1 Tax=Rhodoligotrophos appendicifer TaxID=987056 RepID=UPI001185CCB8|nr:branched-chain amino acid ABC transporter permease [Rhodoligotrophos appendicifer]
MSFVAQIFSGIAIGCIYGLVAIGFSMIYRAMGLVNFAQAEFMMIGAFFGYSVLTAFPEMPFLAVLAIACAGTAVLGVVLERIAFRPAIRRGASDIYLVLLTLGIGMVLSNGARLIWGANPVVYQIPLAHDITRLAGYPLPTMYFYILAFMVLLLVILQWFFTKSWTGLALRAVAEDRKTAQLMGVDAGFASSFSFAIASAIGAAAGVLYAPIIYVSFDMGAVGIKAFAAAVMGGFGSIAGAVVGGVGLGVVEMVGGQLLAPEYQDSVAFAVMILVLLLRPNGLIGKGIAK